ncbi:MAG: OmpA family protein [Rhodobacteraceae bacterium]|nr:OmpA family protein [Paracoccaceae bacterium]
MSWNSAMLLSRSSLLVIAALATLGLAACDEAGGFSGREAGATLNEGAFGTPTRRNAGAQMAYRDLDGSVITMGSRFAAEVPAMVNFAFDSAVLDAEARAALDRQANWIRQNDGVLFRVYGHTDLVGSDAYNHRLGQRRANAVVQYLVSRGVPARRLQGVVSRGRTQPLIPTPEPERRNRRTVTEVAGFGHSFVGSDLDGKYAVNIYERYTTRLPTGRVQATTGSQ